MADLSAISSSLLTLCRLQRFDIIVMFMNDEDKASELGRQRGAGASRAGLETEIGAERWAAFLRIGAQILGKKGVAKEGRLELQQVCIVCWQDLELIPHVLELVK